MDEPIIVIGGGAAGMLAAWRAAMLGMPVLLLEKKGRLGTKILISGGGKCNVTHAGSMEDVRARFRPNEGRFLRPSFYRFTNDDFLALLEEKGLSVYTRPDGRIFPRDGDAGDVVAVLAAHLEDVGVRIRLDTPVREICVEEGCVRGVVTGSGAAIPTRHLVIAAGGSSYPATGTTGDAWPWMARLGHTVVPLRAALAPLYLDPVPPPEWSGVALRDCLLRARRVADGGGVGKEVSRWRGDLLWTYKGISGPTALGVSREVAENPAVSCVATVDILPDEPFEAVSERLRQHASRYPRRAVTDFLEAHLPDRLVRPLFAAAAVDPSVRGAYLTQKERNRMVSTIKEWNIGRIRHVPLERGEVVAGGVALDEVDPQSMRSRIVGGLYLCGEVLDIAGPVGGYNLQAAWSTGYVAGESAAADYQAAMPTGRA